MLNMNISLNIIYLKLHVSIYRFLEENVFIRLKLAHIMGLRNKRVIIFFHHVIYCAQT